MGLFIPMGENFARGKRLKAFAYLVLLPIGAVSLLFVCEDEIQYLALRYLYPLLTAPPAAILISLLALAFVVALFREIKLLRREVERLQKK